LPATGTALEVLNERLDAVLAGSSLAIPAATIEP